MSEFFTGDAVGSSKYLKKFRRLTLEFPGIMELKGDHLLVERLPAIEMKTKSGIILQGAKTFRDTIEDTMTEFGIVLMTGPGQLDEQGNTFPCDSKVGDVILLPGSTYWYGAFGHIAGYEPYSIGRVRDTLIPMWFQDYKKAFEVLNA